MTSALLKFMQRRYEMGDRVGTALADIRDALPPTEAAASRWSDHLVTGTITGVSEGVGHAWPRTDEGAPRVQLDFDDPDAMTKTVHMTITVDASRSMQSANPLGSTVTAGIVVPLDMSIDAARADLLALGQVAVFLVDSPVFNYQPDLYGIARDGTLIGSVDECDKLTFPALPAGVVPEELTSAGLLALPQR